MEGNMGKSLPRICVLACVLLFACTGVVLSQDGSPPGVDKGWNLISSPCDVGIDELHQKLGNDEILVFSWNGGEYDQVDTMERGRGYFLNDNAILNSSIVCKNETPLPEGFAVELHQGWNLIGNPYHRAISFEKAFGRSVNQMSDAIYAWQGHKLRLLDKQDHMIPFRGYWVYANAPVSLLFAETQPDIGPGGADIECNPLVINRILPDADTVIVGDAVTLKAVCTYENEDVDVTAGADWIVDEESVLTPLADEGDYTAAAVGAADVMVEYQGNVAALEITVQEPPNPLESIALSAEKTTFNLNETTALSVIGTYKDGTTEVFTAAAEFIMSTQNVGEINDGVFAALNEGATTVSASVQGLTSNSLRLTVYNITLDKILIETAKDLLEIHETTVILARAVYSNGSVKYVTADVTWQINPDGAASIEKSGRYNPLALGAANITATLDGVRSNTLTINVKPKSLRWLMPKEIYGLDPLPCPSDPSYSWCYTHGVMKLGDEAKIGVNGEFDNAEVRFMAPPYKFELSDASVLSITSYGEITTHKQGLCGIRAYIDGVYSEWLWLYVYTENKSAEFLIMEFSNEETIVEKGHAINIGVTHYKKSDYSNSFTSHNVTRVANWTLADPTVGGMNKGVFTGVKAGDTAVAATFNGLTSNSVDLRVWEPSHLEFCDAGNPNEQSWNDGFSVATLETDCKEYDSSDNVNVCFNAELRNDVFRRVLDVCMDLYIYDENENLVRTFQDRNCSPTPLFRRTEGYHPVYQYCAEWDRKDNSSNIAPKGKYTAVARYYILYCPVLKVSFEIK